MADIKLNYCTLQAVQSFEHRWGICHILLGKAESGEPAPVPSQKALHTPGQVRASSPGREQGAPPAMGRGRSQEGTKRLPQPALVGTALLTGMGISPVGWRMCKLRASWAGDFTEHKLLRAPQKPSPAPGCLCSLHSPLFHVILSSCCFPVAVGWASRWRNA